MESDRENFTRRGEGEDWEFEGPDVNASRTDAESSLGGQKGRSDLLAQPKRNASEVSIPPTQVPQPLFPIDQQVLGIGVDQTAIGARPSEVVSRMSFASPSRTVDAHSDLNGDELVFEGQPGNSNVGLNTSATHDASVGWSWTPERSPSQVISRVDGVATQMTASQDALSHGVYSTRHPKPHLNIRTGKPCSCTWGYVRPSKGLKRTAGGKYEWLQERPDKRLQTPEGQKFLRVLRHYHSDKTDPMFPWLAREWKKGRIRIGQDGINYRLQYDHPEHGTSWLQPNELEHWGDWFKDKNHPTRKGLDIMQHTVSDIDDKTGEWEESKKAEAEERAKQQDMGQRNGGEVVHSYPDGWSLRKLAPENLEWEGDRMAGENGYPICVGGQNYQDAVHSGQSLIYSLRDHEGYPHVTMELDPHEDSIRRDEEDPSDEELMNAMNRHHTMRALEPYMKSAILDYGRDPSGPNVDRQWSELYWQAHNHAKATRPYVAYPESARIEQIQGKGNSVPKPEYQQRLKDWFTTFPEDVRPSWEDREIDHPNDMREEGGDYDGMGNLGGYGPHGDYGVPMRTNYDYDSILGALDYDSYGNWSARRSGYGEFENHNPTAIADTLYQDALKNRKMPEFAKAVEKTADKHQNDYDEWRDMNWEHTVPYPQGEEYPYELPNGEFVNNEEEHEKAHDEDQEHWESEHHGLRFGNYLHRLINPHYGLGSDSDSPDYSNEFFEDPRKQQQELGRGSGQYSMYTHPGVEAYDAQRAQLPTVLSTDETGRNADHEDRDSEDQLFVLGENVVHGSHLSKAVPASHRTRARLGGVAPFADDEGEAWTFNSAGMAESSGFVHRSPVGDTAVGAGPHQVVAANPLLEPGVVDGHSSQISNDELVAEGQEGSAHPLGVAMAEGTNSPFSSVRKDSPNGLSSSMPAFERHPTSAPPRSNGVVAVDTNKRSFKRDSHSLITAANEAIANGRPLPRYVDHSVLQHPSKPSNGQNADSLNQTESPHTKSSKVVQNLVLEEPTEGEGEEWRFGADGANEALVLPIGLGHQDASGLSIAPDEDVRGAAYALDGIMSGIIGHVIDPNVPVNAVISDPVDERSHSDLHSNERVGEGQWEWTPGAESTERETKGDELSAAHTSTVAQTMAMPNGNGVHQEPSAIGTGISNFHSPSLSGHIHEEEASMAEDERGRRGVVEAHNLSGSVNVDDAAVKHGLDHLDVFGGGEFLVHPSTVSDDEEASVAKAQKRLASSKVKPAASTEWLGVTGDGLRASHEQTPVAAEEHQDMEASAIPQGLPTFAAPSRHPQRLAGDAQYYPEPRRPKGQDWLFDPTEMYQHPYEMPESGIVRPGAPGTPMYRYMSIPKDTDPNQFLGTHPATNRGVGNHWTHDYGKVRSLVNDWWDADEDTQAVILHATHPGEEHLMSWDNPQDKREMEGGPHSIVGEDYAHMAYPSELPIRPSAPIDVHGIDVFNGEHDDNLEYTHQHLSKTAGPTDAQRKRLVDAWEHERPDNSTVEHEFPNGWTVRRLQTIGDKDREGRLMRNCWRTDERNFQSPNYDEPINDWYKRNYGPEGWEDWEHGFHSLRDQNNHPRASFMVGQDSMTQDYASPDRVVQNALGHGNSQLSPEYAQMLHEYANAKGYKTKGIGDDPYQPVPATLGEPQRIGADASRPSESPAYYHGTMDEEMPDPQEYINRRTQRPGGGMYFTTALDQAQGYGVNVHQFDVQPQNPLVVDHQRSAGDWRSQVENRLNEGNDDPNVWHGWPSARNFGHDAIVYNWPGGGDPNNRYTVNNGKPYQWTIALDPSIVKYKGHTHTDEWNGNWRPVSSTGIANWSMDTDRYSPQELADNFTNIDQHTMTKDGSRPERTGIPEDGVMYHTAPTEDRERIRRWGLIPAKPQNNPRHDPVEVKAIGNQPEGVYLVSSPEMYGAGDLWQVEVDPSRLSPDPHRRWQFRPDHAFVHDGPIAPEQMTLHTPYEEYNLPYGYRTAGQNAAHSQMSAYSQGSAYSLSPPPNRPLPHARIRTNTHWAKRLYSKVRSLVSGDHDYNEPMTDTALTMTPEWSPGNTGKAIVYPDGTVRSWSVDKFGAPHHSDFSNSPSDEAWVEIRPHGVYDSWSTLTPEGHAALHQHHPALKHSGEQWDGWTDEYTHASSNSTQQTPPRKPEDLEKEAHLELGLVPPFENARPGFVTGSYPGMYPGDDDEEEINGGWTPEEGPLYHVTAPENRERIKAWGLKPGKPEPDFGSVYDLPGQPLGLYTHRSEDGAEQWEWMEGHQNIWGPTNHGDIWEINPDYVQDWNHNDHYFPECVVVPHDIPPEALKLRTDLGRYWPTSNARPKIVTRLSQRQGMALTPELLQRWVQEHGPYMYHGGYDADVPSILKEGIKPGMTAGGQEPATHAYLAHPDTAGSWAEIRSGANAPQIRVDLRKLDPANIDFDPDAKITPGTIEDGYMQRGPNGEILDREQWAPQEDWESADWVYPEEHWLRQPTDPQDTFQTMQGYPSIAHRGVVPPEALDVNPEWNPELSSYIGSVSGSHADGTGGEGPGQEWTPGEYGKGVLLNDGSVENWNVDPEDDAPHHIDKYDIMHDCRLLFSIEPDGTLNRLDPHPGKDYNINEVTQGDSRLIDPGSRFHFGSVPDEYVCANCGGEGQAEDVDGDLRPCEDCGGSGDLRDGGIWDQNEQDIQKLKMELEYHGRPNPLEQIKLDRTLNDIHGLPEYLGAEKQYPIPDLGVPIKQVPQPWGETSHGLSWPIFWNGSELEVGPLGGYHHRVWDRGQRPFSGEGRLYPDFGNGHRINWYGEEEPDWPGKQEWKFGASSDGTERVSSSEDPYQLRYIDGETPFLNFMGQREYMNDDPEADSYQGVNAYHGDNLVGSLTWSNGGVRHLYVDPAHRGQGLMHQMLNHYDGPVPVGRDNFETPELADKVDSIVKNSSENELDPWEPGWYGKGIIGPEGQVHTWVAGGVKPSLIDGEMRKGDENWYMGPHHEDGAEVGAIDIDDPETYSFNIMPDGGVHTPDWMGTEIDESGKRSLNEQDWELLKAHHPDLHNPASKFRFGSEDKWEPGEQGRGLLYPSGTVDTWGWPADQEEDGPLHVDYYPIMTRKGDPRSGDPKHLWIQPDGYVDHSFSFGDSESASLNENEIAAIKGHHPTLHTPEETWNKKFAKGGVFYHVAPMSAREKILQEGLRGADEVGMSPWQERRDLGKIPVDQPSGVYLWDSPENARLYAYGVHGAGSPDSPHPGDNMDDEWEDRYLYDEDTDEYRENPDYFEHGYDIWKVNAQGMPVDTDPERRLWEGDLSAGEAQQAINQQVKEYGEPERSEGWRFYTPQAVPPHRVELHQTLPYGEMTEDDFYDTLENARQIPEQWERVPFDQWNEKARQRYLGGLMTPKKDRYTGNGFGKGFWHPQTGLVTWDTLDPDGEPYHGHMLQRFGIPPQSMPRAGAEFLINPDGETEFFNSIRGNYEVPQEARDAISAHPRLNSMEDAFKWAKVVEGSWSVEESDVKPEESVLAEYAGHYTHSPWITDPASRTIYLGEPGVHHADLKARHIPNDISNPGEGIVNNGMLSAYQFDWDQIPYHDQIEIRDALHGHLGPGFGDGEGWADDGDEFHFGSDEYDFYNDRPPSWRNNEYVEWMEPTQLWPYREFDRDLSRHDELEKHVEEHGIKEPIKLEYNPDTGHTHIGEGNHRVKMAIRDGWPALPVTVFRGYRRPQEGSGQPAPQMIEPDRHGYVPGCIRPSEIGLPTIEQPESMQDNRVYSASQNGWTPGNPGKGWVDSDGQVITWNVDPDTRRPFHMYNRPLQVMQMHDERGDLKQSGSFEITPDGHIHRFGEPVDPYFSEHILREDPRLTAGDWRF